MSDEKKKLPKLFGIPPLYYLLVAFPLAIYFHYAHFGDLWIFVTACVAIIPLAGLMGRATESLAESMGPAAGGLLNATFGNAAELIIALSALRQGKVEMVKASITGSIIGNILLVLGLSILVGGLRFKRQTFNRTAAGLGTTMMALATIGLLVPTIFYFLTDKAPHLMPVAKMEAKMEAKADVKDVGPKAEPKAEANVELEHLSEEIAAVLAFMYVLSLIFTLKTHHHLFAEEEVCGPEDKIEPEWGRAFALAVLVAATACVAVMSEFLVASVESAALALGMTEIFVGVIVVAIIGNAAEHSTAVLMALKDKMDVAVTIAVGSSIQVAMFVAPTLVAASVLLGTPMDLHFSAMEVIAVVIAMAVMSLVAQDGESHWMEGALLLAVYGVIGLAFYHLPG